MLCSLIKTVAALFIHRFPSGAAGKQKLNENRARELEQRKNARGAAVAAAPALIRAAAAAFAIVVE